MIEIIKTGGSTIDNPAAFHELLERVSSGGHPKILVHGGGKMATDLSQRLSVPVKMIDGRRVTTEDGLKITVMIYAGLINKSIVAALQQRGCNAIGLSGADGNLILAEKRSPVPVDYGYAGDIMTVNTVFLKELLERGFTPVISPITHDGNGQLLNTNADSVATSVACALAAIGEDTVLTFISDKAGVLRNPDDESTLIRSINVSEYREMKKRGEISGGMIPKVENALKALEKGVRKININETEIVSDTHGNTRQYNRQ